MIVESELRYCPHCASDLPIGEFGISRARSDGLNRYCRKSINIKIGLQRQAHREYKAARKAAPKPLRKLSPADKVREAIRLGAREQKEIVRVTRLSRDEVTDCIAELLLDRREIRTEERGNARMYFIRSIAA